MALHYLHICQDDDSPCLEAIQADSVDDMADAFEFHNKCDDCCPVIDCPECGPCEIHDAILAKEGITSTYAKT